MEKRLIGIKELSEKIDISPNTVYNWVSQRRIPYVKIGRLTKFDSQKIDDWIEERSIDKEERERDPLLTF